MQFTENTISVEVKDGVYFRLEDCSAYERVKGRSVKEMDLGWVENGSIWLTEFKDYGPSIPAELSAAVEKLENTIPAKLRDTVTMLAAVWAETPWGNELLDNIRDTCDNFPASARPIQAVTIVRIEQDADIELLSAMQDKVQAQLAGICDVMDVKTLILPPEHEFVDSLGITIKVDKNW